MYLIGHGTERRSGERFYTFNVGVSSETSHVSLCSDRQKRDTHNFISRLDHKSRRLFLSLPIDSYDPSPLRSDSSVRTEQKKFDDLGSEGELTPKRTMIPYRGLWGTPAVFEKSKNKRVVTTGNDKSWSEPNTATMPPALVDDPIKAIQFLFSSVYLRKVLSMFRWPCLPEQGVGCV